MRVLLLATAMAVALAGCGKTAIDGFVIGQRAGCSPPVGPGAGPISETCADYPAKAIAALDAREPGHAAIESFEMYTEGHSNRPASEVDFLVFVFKLADGSTKATGVVCSVSGCVGVGSYPIS